MSTDTSGAKYPDKTIYRFWVKVDKSASDGCWLWTASCDSYGYPRISVNGRLVSATRFSYELTNSPIESGKELHHTCGKRKCVQPAHLKPLTRQEHLALHGLPQTMYRGHKDPIEEAITHLIQETHYPWPDRYETSG